MGVAALVRDPYLPAHGNPGYRVTHYHLTLDYRPASGRLGGRAQIYAIATEDLADVRLDLAGLRPGRVLVDGVPPVRFAHGNEKLRIRPAAPIAAGRSFEVDVRYTGTPRPIRTKEWGELGWDSLADGALVASQPIGAPSWFPCNDRPSDKASYLISVTAPTPYTVVASGELVSRRVGAGATTWVYHQPAPTPTYLVTVQIGQYGALDLAGGAVPQRVYAPAGLRARCRHDFGRQPAMVAEFARLFGPYPFGEYAVVVTEDELDVPVEAQAMSVFGANHVDGRRSCERLVAHELAHQWFGNSLTVEQWRHIWLNEGFAKYAEWLWSEVSGGEPAGVWAARSHARLATQPQQWVLADPGVRHLFDDRVYQRGALTLHALRTAMGDARFFDLLRAWTAAHRHGTVTTEGFTELARRFSAEPLGELFEAWLYEPALPALARG
jgi:aminopeptidase N